MTGKRWAVTGVLACALLAPGTSAAAAPQKGSTPELIERAHRAGDIGLARATLYRTYALGRPQQLPARFRGTEPWDGTLVARDVRRALPKLRPSVLKADIKTILTPRSTGPAGLGTSACLVSAAPMPDTAETPHFYIEYNAATLGGGLEIEDYVSSLEGAWTTEVNRFGWAAPPVLPSAPPPGAKYHVRIDTLSPLIYGFVSNIGSHAGATYDNPTTAWDDKDADASCMVLNNDFSLFPGTPRQALDATTAHELNHSIQYGYGALNGEHVPDDSFVEGGATWMEDEVYDDADDNYNYLWPSFEDDMGEYDDSPYPYWITFRGLFERYGAGRRGGSEQVFQRFWELISQEKAGGLAAMDLALRTRGQTLPNAFHAYAIAVKFNRRCGGGYGYPYCFEEGPQYVEAAEPTAPHGTIAAPGDSYEGTVPDNLAINWVALPDDGPSYTVSLTNTSAGGALRGTVVCDTGSRFVFRNMPAIATAGRTVRAAVDSRRCEEAVAVVTNDARTAADPSASEERSYAVETAPR